MKSIFFILLLPLTLFSQVGEDEFVNPKDLIPDLVVDLRYATPNHKFYNLPNGDMPLPKFYTVNEALVTRKLADYLKVAQDSLRNIRNHNGKEYPSGIGIKLWDGYRPRAVQYLFWEIFPNPIYIANPTSGSKHNRGGAADITLVDLSTGNELKMPTLFDDFSDVASHSYTNLSSEIIANRELLYDILVNVAGMISYNAEWWHYEVPGANAFPLKDFQMK